MPCRADTHGNESARPDIYRVAISSFFYPVWGEDRAASQVFDAESRFAEAYRATGRHKDPLYDRLAMDPLDIFDEAQLFPDQKPPYGRRIGLTLQPVAGHVVALSVVRAKDAPAPGKAQMTCLAMLRSHLQRALELHEAAASHARLPGSCERLLDSMDCAVALVSGRGQVLHANQSMQDLEHGCRVHRGFLKATAAEDQVALDTLIAATFIKTADRSGVASVPLRDPARLRPLIAHAMLLPSDQQPDPLWRPLDRQRALVLVADPERSAREDREPPLRLLGLTRTEARVAALIAEGESPERIAGICDIESSTVRVHLKRIYAKLDVSGQLELAVLLNRLANPLGGAFAPQVSRNFDAAAPHP
jgi:DNA-binding CsgD family transcriptional regulator/PAS domain-containing protein